MRRRPRARTAIDPALVPPSRRSGRARWRGIAIAAAIVALALVVARVSTVGSDARAIEFDRTDATSARDGAELADVVEPARGSGGDERRAAQLVEPSAPAARPRITAVSSLGIPLQWVDVRTPGIERVARAAFVGGRAEFLAPGPGSTLASPGHREVAMEPGRTTYVLEPDASLVLEVETATRPWTRSCEHVTTRHDARFDAAALRGATIHAAGETPRGYAIAVDGHRFGESAPKRPTATFAITTTDDRRIDVRWNARSGEHVVERLDLGSASSPASALDVDLSTATGEPVRDESVFLRLVALTDRADDARTIEREWGTITIRDSSEPASQLAAVAGPLRFENVRTGRRYALVASSFDDGMHGRAIFEFDGARVPVVLHESPRVRAQVVLDGECATGRKRNARVHVEFLDPAAKGGVAPHWTTTVACELDEENRLVATVAGEPPSAPDIVFPCPRAARITIEVPGCGAWTGGATWGRSPEVDLGPIRLDPRDSDLVFELPAVSIFGVRSAYVSGRASECRVSEFYVRESAAHVTFAQPLDTSRLAAIVLRAAGEASYFGLARGADGAWIVAPAADCVLEVLVPATSTSPPEFELLWSGVSWPLSDFRRDESTIGRSTVRFEAPASGLVLSTDHGGRHRRFALEAGRNVIDLR